MSDKTAEPRCPKCGHNNGDPFHGQAADCRCSDPWHTSQPAVAADGGRREPCRGGYPGGVHSYIEYGREVLCPVCGGTGWKGVAAPRGGQERPPHAEEPPPCKLCGHGMRDNIHGLDQNDFDGDQHSGRCTYCRICNPRPSPAAPPPQEGKGTSGEQGDTILTLYDIAARVDEQLTAAVRWWLR